MPTATVEHDQSTLEVVQRPTLTYIVGKWSPVLIITALISTLARHAARPLSDPDTLWHLHIGAEYWDTWSVSNPGHLTRFATRPWFAREWLSDWTASKFEAVFGLPGVAWMYGAAMIVLAVTAFVVCRKFSGSLAAAIATVLCTLGAMSSLTPRPQVASFVLILIATGAWLKTATDLKPRWWLIPLAWLGANLHGFWFVTVVVGVVVILGLLLERRLSSGAALQLAVVPLGSVLVAMLTPVGPKLVTAVVGAADRAEYASEMLPPDFRTAAPAITMAMICLVVVTWTARCRREVPWTHIALLVLATGLTLFAARTVAVGSLTAAPLAAIALQSWIPNRRDANQANSEITAVSAVAATCLIGLAFAVPHTSERPGEVPNGLNPELAALPAGTVVLNQDELGGWLHWRHPNTTPVFSTMMMTYQDSYTEAYSDTLHVAEGWDSFVYDRGATYALLPGQSPLATALRERLDWRDVGIDDGYALLRAPSE